MIPQSANPEDWVTLAILGRTRGIRGELTSIAFSKPERFTALDRVYLFGDGRPFKVESTWWHGATLIFKFEGIDDIDAAEKLIGSEVRVPRDQRAPLESGEYYQSDLIGCQVVDCRTGQSIGPVTALDDGGGSSGLLVVGGSLLIPFVRAICVEIDLPARRIAVDLPEGLRDLNQS